MCKLETKKTTLDKRLTEWLIILTCFGYPLQAMVVILLKVEPTPINIRFRSLYLLISLYLIFSRLIRKGPRPSKVLFVFILFWAIYGMRLMYDLEIRGLTYMGYSKFYVYSWAFGCSFIPAWAVFLNADRINLKRLVICLFIILILANIGITGSMIHFSSQGVAEILLSRFQLGIIVKGVSFLLINGISISFYGELLCLAALGFFIVYHKVISLPISLLLWFAFVLGMFNLFAGASRGPMVSFILISLLIMIYSIVTVLSKLIRKRYTSKPRVTNYSFSNLVRISMTNAKIKRLMRTIMGPLIIMSVLYFIHGPRKLNFEMFRRMSATSELRISEPMLDRVSIWQSSWSQFKEHPYVGDSFINNVSKIYSHNIILDSLMSTGLLGTIPFLTYLAMPFLLFFQLNQRQKRDLAVIFILFLGALLLYMTSGGLFTSAEFWILSALIIGISSIKKQSRTVVQIET